MLIGDKLNHATRVMNLKFFQSKPFLSCKFLKQLIKKSVI